MDFNGKHIDLILQYVLLTAGEEDDFEDRDLGPIHLLKYVYLADLAYAQRHNGDSYTGIDWQFYKFGPWSSIVHNRIDTALACIHANKKIFDNNYGNDDDWTRWSLRDEGLLSQIGKKLPLVITSRIRSDVHKYGKDTPSLLDRVYKTKPMLMARPMEYLTWH